MADETFEIINVTEDPETEKWAFPRMYKRSLTGGMLYWQIGYVPDIHSIRRWHGYVGTENEQVEDYEVTLNTTGRDYQEQALLEARNEYRKKVRGSYLAEGSTEPRQVTVMRANAYDPDKPVKEHVYVDTKLNGFRMTAKMVDGQVQALTRGNKPIYNIEHILEECEKILEFMPPFTTLDGELYTPHLHFQEITGTGRQKTRRGNQVLMLEYHVFDAWWEENPPLEVRRERLERAFHLYRESEFGKDYVSRCGPLSDYYDDILPSYKSGGRCPDLADDRTLEEIDEGVEVGHPYTKIFLAELHEANTPQEIDAIFNNFVERGFEGAMIKKLANGAAPGTPRYKMSQYLFGKGSRILKYKPVITEEGICIDLYEGKGKEKGLALLTLINEKGKTFNARPKGDHDLRREWFQHPEQVLGKPVTFEYRDLTKDDLPQHAVPVAIRDYEGYSGLNKLQLELGYKYLKNSSRPEAKAAAVEVLRQLNEEEIVEPVESKSGLIIRSNFVKQTSFYCVF